MCACACSIQYCSHRNGNNQFNKSLANTPVITINQCLINKQKLVTKHRQINNAYKSDALHNISLFVTLIMYSQCSAIYSKTRIVYYNIV